jgi:hypothetical protein
MSNQLRVTKPEYRSVENTSGVDIDKGTILKAAATGTDGLVEVAACGDGELPYGVAAEDIASGDIGDSQVRGVALVLCAAAVTIGGEVSSSASSTANDAASTDRILGTALTAGGAAAFAEVELAGFGPQAAA